VTFCKASMRDVSPSEFVIANAGDQGRRLLSTLRCHMSFSNTLLFSTYLYMNTHKKSRCLAKIP
jgi:hypothetical protein